MIDEDNDCGDDDDDSVVAVVVVGSEKRRWWADVLADLLVERRATDCRHDKGEEPQTPGWNQNLFRFRQ